MSSTSRVFASSYQKKEIGKRSSPYTEEENGFHSRDKPLSKKRLKHSKTRRKKGNRHHSSKWASNDENKHAHEKKPRKNRKNRNKSHKHKSKNKMSKQKSLTSPYEVKYDTGQKIRHNAQVPDFGKYSSNSISSVIEKPILKNDNIPYAYTNFKPKSAPLASEVFNVDENKNFERWKIKYGGKTEDYKYPEWPRFRSEFQTHIYRPKPKIANTRYEPKVHHRHSEDSYKNKMKEIRRWGLLKQNRKNILKNLSENNDAGSENWKETNSIESGGRQTDKLVDKAKILATNKWPSPEESKEKVWQRFTYHRVTSSPSVQQRDAGAQPRHPSAYVAVSVIPSNSTGKCLSV